MVSTLKRLFTPFIKRCRSMLLEQCGRCRLGEKIRVKRLWIPSLRADCWCSTFIQKVWQSGKNRRVTPNTTLFGVCCTISAEKRACTGASKKDIEAIENTLEEYGDALREADAEALLETTDWDDDDDAYLEAAEVMRFDTQNDYAVKYYSAVAKTITIDYESDDIEIKDGKATIKVTYEIVDWEEVL